MSQHAGTERLDSGLAHAGVRSYVSGFAMSILFTIAAYLLVTDRVLPTGPLVAVILVAALAQLAPSCTASSTSAPSRGRAGSSSCSSPWRSSC